MGYVVLWQSQELCQPLTRPVRKLLKHTADAPRRSIGLSHSRGSPDDPAMQRQRILIAGSRKLKTNAFGPVGRRRLRKRNAKTSEAEILGVS